MLNDLISRQAAVDALMRRLNADYLDGYEYLEELKEMPSVQPTLTNAESNTELSVDLISRADALSCFHDWIDKYGDVHTADEITEYRMIEQLASVETEPQWIPCRINNQCYIPELKDIDYKGVLFTYETKTGRRLVKVHWIERGRMVGKQMNGTPVAYMPLPEPWRGDAE